MLCHRPDLDRAGCMRVPAPTHKPRRPSGKEKPAAGRRGSLQGTRRNGGDPLMHRTWLPSEVNDEVSPACSQVEPTFCARRYDSRPANVSPIPAPPRSTRAPRGSGAAAAGTHPSNVPARHRRSRQSAVHRRGADKTGPARPDESRPTDPLDGTRDQHR
jgi:hypothetical protein